jgi:hypothetical protein
MQNSFDTTILNQISPELHQYKYSNGIHNFRCLYCGDSKNNKTKARGYIFTSKTNSLVVKCHNCSISVSFSHFLSDHFPQIYKEYNFSRYQEKYTSQEIEIKLPTKPIYKPDIFKNIKTAEEVHKNHTAKLYLRNRKIPEKYFKEFFLLDDFKGFTNNIIPNKFIISNYKDYRLTVPLILNKNLIGYQGRTIDPQNKLRYITIMLDNSKPKVWGFDKVNKSKPVYITEGIFDAMFVDNAIAMLGSDLSLDFIRSYPGINFVFIFDNERGNPQIVNRMRNVIDLGYSILIWNKGIIQKDINDYILSGGDMELLLTNVFSGIRAKLELTNWLH